MHLKTLGPDEVEENSTQVDLLLGTYYCNLAIFFSYLEYMYIISIETDLYPCIDLNTASSSDIQEETCSLSLFNCDISHFIPSACV